MVKKYKSFYALPYPVADHEVHVMEKQRCPNTSELEPLYLSQQLYLRPVAKLTVSLQLPNVKKLGKSVSHWEIMDRLKELIRPDEFTVLKVTKTTMEFVRFEAEVEKRAKLERVISKIDNKMIKLKDFGELMRVRAAEFRSDFPNRRVWDAFFSESKDMDEMKPGERPDTVHIANLPSKWFIPYHLTNDEDATPSEKIFYRVFEKFGNIRYVDIPTCDPYRKKMKDHISGIKYSSFDKMDWFEGYVQFKDYIGFTKAMEFFRDKKLVHKDDDGDTEVDIKVDFDRTKHLSDASIRRREIVRDRLVKKAREKEERDKKELEEKKKQEEEERKKGENLQKQREIRRRVREEKRKAKIMKKLQITGSDEINAKIAKEEKKLIRVQRRLEAIRLVEELFRRIKEKHQGDIHRYDVADSRVDELKRLKNHSELDYLSQKEKLHNAVKGRVMLKTILSDDVKTAKYSNSSDSELSLDEEPISRKVRNPLHVPHPAELMYDNHPPAPPPMYGFPYQPMYTPFAPAIYPDIDIYAVYRGGRGRGGRGRGRGGFYRGRGGPPPAARAPYPPEVFEEYSKYYNKPPRNQYDRRRSRSGSPHSSRRHRSRSASRRRSYDRSRSRSYSRRSKSRSRSRSRRHSDKRYDRDSRSRSRSRSNRRHSRTRSRSRIRERSRSKSRKESRSERRTRSNDRKSRSRSKTRDRKSRSRSKTRPKSRSRSRDQSLKEQSSKRREKDRSKSRSRSREKSVDSSKFLTPRQLMEQKEQGQRSRSKSWSLPKDGEPGKSRSWSRSPETQK